MLSAPCDDEVPFHTEAGMEGMFAEKVVVARGREIDLHGHHRVRRHLNAADATGKFRGEKRWLWSALLIPAPLFLKCERRRFSIYECLIGRMPSEGGWSKLSTQTSLSERPS
jgi:hypothetical protein